MTSVTFGEWTETNNLQELTRAFKCAKPFEHVVIDDFFDPETVARLSREFPNADHPNWHRYHSPIEKKSAMNRFHNVDSVFRSTFAALMAAETLDRIQSITSIPALENDPHMHGAGIHYHDRGDKLDIHLDYSLHPITGKERRINIIVYLNEDWREEYGGHIELWDAQCTRSVVKVAPVFNRAVLFRTSDLSWHGLPTPLRCPEGKGRKSLASYYVSDAREGANLRSKAEFRPVPWQPVDDRLAKFYEIRRSRRLEPEDLESIYPDWEHDTVGDGFWRLSTGESLLHRRRSTQDTYARREEL